MLHNRTTIINTALMMPTLPGVRSWPRKVVDALALLFGDKDHCQQSYESERLGRQLPPEERTSK